MFSKRELLCPFQKIYFEQVCLESSFIGRILWYFPVRLATFAMYYNNQSTNFAIFPETDRRISRIFSHSWRHGDYQHLPPQLIVETSMFPFHVNAGRISQLTENFHDIFLVTDYQISYYFSWPIIRFRNIFRSRMSNFAVLCCDWFTKFKMFFPRSVVKVRDFFLGWTDEFLRCVYGI